MNNNLIRPETQQAPRGDDPWQAQGQGRNRPRGRCRIMPDDCPKTPICLEHNSQSKGTSRQRPRGTAVRMDDAITMACYIVASIKKIRSQFIVTVQIYEKKWRMTNLSSHFNICRHASSVHIHTSECPVRAGRESGRQPARNTRMTRLRALPSQGHAKTTRSHRNDRTVFGIRNLYHSSRTAYKRKSCRNQGTI